jgi:hypothetical protein
VGREESVGKKYVTMVPSWDCGIKMKDGNLVDWKAETKGGDDSIDDWLRGVSGRFLVTCGRCHDG